jgi:Zn finger protein HypA/HybF involved in hydrogenase expression
MKELNIPCKTCGQLFESDGHEVRCNVCRIERIRTYLRWEENKKETIKIIKRHLKGLETAINELE